MAEKHTSMTTARQERGMTRPSSFGFGGPITALQRFADEVDRMFEEFGMPRAWSSWSRASQRGGALWAPAIDVVQKDDQLVVKADIPGIKKDDLSIEVTDDAITIEGERIDGGGYSNPAPRRMDQLQVRASPTLPQMIQVKFERFARG